jgi:hypothetical protein
MADAVIENDADFIEKAYGDVLKDLVKTLIKNNAASTPGAQGRFCRGLAANREARKMAMRSADSQQPAKTPKKNSEWIREAYEEAIGGLFSQLVDHCIQQEPDPQANYEHGLAVIRKSRDQAFAWTPDDTTGP